MSRWSVGVLTWNRHDRCRVTLSHLHSSLLGKYSLTVLDNGSDIPFSANGSHVIRHQTNVGAGAGLSTLIRHLLDTDPSPDFLLFTEDDWTLENALHLDALEPLLSDPSVGQVRLAVRDRQPSPKYWTYALSPDEAQASLRQSTSTFSSYPGGEYQRVRLLWSNNPFACTALTARRFLLTGLDEIRMARPYLDSGLFTLSTTPGHFRHHGQIRDRRGEPGWKK